jgi:enoyl-CoA hydratase
MSADALTGELTQVQYARRGPAAWLTLHRPAKRNALTPTMVSELNRGLDRAEREAGLRALVITGAGPAFCAGADLGFFSELVDTEDGCDRFLAELIDPLYRFLSRLRSSPLPVIAAVNGACAAGGLETVLCCDLIVASANATFCDAHSRLGLAPAIGGTAGLVAALGVHRAKQLLLVSDTYSADLLAAWGLVAEVVERDRLDATVSQLTQTLSRRSPDSLRLMKQAVRRGHEPDWHTQVAADLADFRQLWRSPDLREGLRAYAERRDPVFT